mmetsp:Transcript_103481/g.221252  ORF Transcript_103481/g.221252 Transcript_103481/m.221252 type:complete len:518 (+) Transcript_103481:80-1633(+)
MSELCAYTQGTEVLAFFRSNDSPKGLRYVKVKDKSETFPIIGLSAGWLTGTIAEDFNPRSFDVSDPTTYVRISFSGIFRDSHGSVAESLCTGVSPYLIRKNTREKTPAVLSLFCVRWWDYWTNTRWSDYDITNDAFFMDLFDGPCGVNAVLPGQYEMHTAWVKSSSDLAQISGELVKPLLKAPNISAFLFLWPSRRTNADTKPGYICEHQFFSMCQRLERSGIPCGWPHIAYLYRQLCGKLWVPQMCLHPDFKVPATTRVHYAEFAEQGEVAAEKAIGCLLELRKSSGINTNAVSVSELKGVVKLGFSWMGDDVLPFCGVKSLTGVLKRLFNQPESNQIVCLVQEMVPNVVCELRVLCFHDAVKQDFVKERLWVRMGRPGEVARHHEGCCDVPEFTLASTVVVPEKEVVTEFFNGSLAAMRSAMDAADDLVEQWLCWYCTECPEPPSTTRLDFLVSYTPGKDAEVWSCEVSECGSSLCSVEVDARNMAVLNSAMRNDESGAFPKPLPSIKHNDSWKS